MSGGKPLAPPWDDLRRVIALAVAEDLPDGDPTGSIVGDRLGAAGLVAREPGTICGLVAVPLVLDEVERALGTRAAEVATSAVDGDQVERGEVLAAISGSARALLAGERTALNLVSHLSGIATATAAMVRAVAGTGALVRDTRKTLPGLRALEKYAVRCGGGVNHRMSLSDAVLVKDNHVAALGGTGPAVKAAQEVARRRVPALPVEVEVDDLRELEDALGAGAELVLLDNMALGDIAAAARRARAAGAMVEVSGGVSLRSVREIAECGVDYIAVGALTHSAPALDVGLDWRC